MKLVEDAVKNLGLSMRAYTRVLRVARTIADLEGSVQVRETHIAESLQYRQMSYGNHIRAA
jgi:magnesium chelatase family protein